MERTYEANTEVLFIFKYTERRHAQSLQGR
jgi:hypothetical protein